MPQVTTKMGLVTWNQLLDPYDYQQLTNNWNKIDFHDHTPGRGVPIPMGGIAPRAVGVTQLASDVPIIQTGSIVIWPMNAVPAGYLLCDGTPYQITTYSTLYGVIGTTYNVAPPLGYFNVPLINFAAPGYGQLNWVIKD